MIHPQRNKLVITFAQFEEENLLPETHDDAGSGEKFNDNSITLPLIGEEEMDAMDPGDEYEDGPMPP